MNEDKKHRVCPAERAGVLDFFFRKWIHNPKKILEPYVKAGMTALDLGCGPGFFTMEMAKLVGKAGQVTAADLQEGMLAIVREKIKKSGLTDRVKLHLCRSEGIGLTDKFDFILVFYMLHEVPRQAEFFQELKALLKPDGKVLIAEPKWHVSRDEFQISIDMMKRAGFAIPENPRILFSRTVVIAIQP